MTAPIIEQAMASEGEAGFVYDAFGSHATDPDGDLLRTIESAVEGFHQRHDVPKHYLRELQLCVDGRDFVFPRKGREQAAVTIETVVRAYQRRSRALVVFAGPQSRDHPWINKEIEWWDEERPDGPVYFALTHGENPSDSSVIMPSALLARGGGDTTVFFDLRGYYKRQNLVQALLSPWRGGTREQALRREARNWKSVRSFDEETTKLVARLVSDATGNAVSVADLEAAYAKADRRTKTKRTVVTAIVSMFLLAATAFAGVQYLAARTRHGVALPSAGSNFPRSGWRRSTDPDQPGSLSAGADRRGFSHPLRTGGQMAELGKADLSRSERGGAGRPWRVGIRRPGGWKPA